MEPMPFSCTRTRKSSSPRSTGRDAPGARPAEVAPGMVKNRLPKLCAWARLNLIAGDGVERRRGLERRRRGAAGWAVVVRRRCRCRSRRRRCRRPGRERRERSAVPAFARGASTVTCGTVTVRSGARCSRRGCRCGLRCLRCRRRRSGSFRRRRCRRLRSLRRRRRCLRRRSAGDAKHHERRTAQKKQTPATDRHHNPLHS